MRWAIKHKSGRTLFVTSDEFIASNRKEMGWIVEEVKMTSREQFEMWIKEETGFDLWRTEYPMTEWDDQQYKCHQTNLAWMAWQASRAAIDISLGPDINSLMFNNDVMFGYHKAKEEATANIRASGIRVKEKK